MIQFLLNDELIQITDEPADLSLLDFLREHRQLTGTKEGCGSGDCGACTVVLAEVMESSSNQNNSSKRLHYTAINSCITFLSALHKKQVITVEHLTNDGQLHPVQQAMVDANATQCGFCTPGFVMSIFALYQNNVCAKDSGKETTIDREQIINTLSGNLCRCTGYKPIIEAALEVCNSPNSHNMQDAYEQTIIGSLENIPASGGSNARSFLPTTRAELAKYINENPEAHLVAGSTDLALIHTQELQALPVLISLKHMPELRQIDVSDNSLDIGACCDLSSIEPIFLQHFPDAKELFERFAGVPIRNQATMGGNIANASPIGDLPPLLMALKASVVLDNGESTRTVALREFYTGYKQTVLAKKEWIKSINIPLLKSSQKLKVYKVSKRIEDDISAVCMAVCISLRDGEVESLSTGFGGVAATPTWSEKLETTLVGKNWHQQSNVEFGKACLSDAFTPISDVRASAEYRKLIVQNLWHRFWLETNASQLQIQTRVSEHA